MNAYQLCLKLLEEARQHLDRGDAMQASEKLYKVAEEAIKELARLHGLPEHEESAKVGRWSVKRLDSAARRLSEVYGGELYEAWSLAYDYLHIRGFHERELTPEQVREAVPKLELFLRVLAAPA